MLGDRDTVMVGVSTLVDEGDQSRIAPHKPRRRGRQPALAESEGLTLRLLGQWLGVSARGLLRHAATSWRGSVPRLLSQSAFNRRARDLGGACAALVRWIAAARDTARTAYQVVDAVPVPRARLWRGPRPRLCAAAASIGRGGSDRHVSYGCHLRPATTADAGITGLLVGPARTAGRWLLDALLCWRADPSAEPWTVTDIPTPRKRKQGYVGPTGPRWWPGSGGDPRAAPDIADDGFTGAAGRPHWPTDDGAVVFTCADSGAATPPATHTAHHAWRHGIEPVKAVLDDVFHPAYPGAKTIWGVVTRIAATCAAYTCGRWLHRLFGRPALALGTLYPG